MKIQSVNPATEEIIGEYEAETKEEVTEKVKLAKKAFREWKKLDVKERVDYIKKLGRELEKNKEELARLITNEMGKPIKESISEIEKCKLLIDYYCENSEKFLEPELVETKAKKSYINFEPLGIVTTIMPWNYPFWLVFRSVVPSLLVGNVSILKLSSLVLGCSTAILNLFNSARFPDNVFQHVIGRGDIIEPLFYSTDGISFTGSVKTGRKIAELAGKNLKKLVLELGGSDPFIVLEDADLNLACNGGVSSRFKNCGQACNAAKRFILVETIANEFIKNFVEITENLKVGGPLDENTQMGPLASKEQLTKIEGQVNDAIAKGAKVLTGGKKLAGKGYFFQPTVLTQVTREMKVLKEEVFGPVAPMVVVKNEREAIRKANDTEFGLGASIWSKDEEKAEKLAKEVDAGTVFINKVVSSNPKLPFGGVKQSGIGREMARYGLLEFTNIKPIVIG